MQGVWNVPLQMLMSQPQQECGSFKQVAQMKRQKPLQEPQAGSV